MNRPILLMCLVLTVLSGCDSQAEAAAESAAATQSAAVAPAAAVAETDAALGDRIVVASGALTELVFALGHGDRVVAVDTSSIYPAETSELPKVGFFRKLGSEPILALRPTTVLATDSAGPEQTLDQLRASDVRVEVFEEPESFAEASEQIRRLAELLGTPDHADALVRSLQSDLEAVDATASDVEASALFVYARGPNVLMVAGTDTVADTMLRRAGLANAAAAVDGFKPMTPESVVEAAPDVIVMTTKGAASVGGWKGVAGLPGVSSTPAAKTEQLATVDDLPFLSFGPRTPQTLRALQAQIAGEDHGD